MKVLVGIVAFVLVALFAWFVVYPFVFNGVVGLFDSNDLGTIIALAACALVTIPLIWLALALVALSVFFTAVGEDRRRFKRERARRNERFNR